jgi:hypothetical protein
MKKGYKIAIAAGAAGLAYLLWKKWDDIFPPKDDEIKPVPDDSANAKASTDPGSNGAPSQYQQLVGQLQSLFGLTIDLKPGKQTNGKLEYLYSVSDEPLNVELAAQNNYPNLNKWGKGVISPENIAYYVEAVKNKWTPRDLTPYRRAGERIKAYNKGWFTRDIELPLVVGTGGTAFKQTGGYAKIPKGNVYEFVAWNWATASMYVRIDRDGVKRIVQVFGPQLLSLSVDMALNPKIFRKPSYMEYGQKI